MTAIHTAAVDTQAASGLEGGIALRPGGKKKSDASSLVEGLFAGILAQAREALSLTSRAFISGGAASREGGKAGSAASVSAIPKEASNSKKPSAAESASAALKAQLAAKGQAAEKGGQSALPSAASAEVAARAAREKAASPETRSAAPKETPARAKRSAGEAADEIPAKAGISAGASKAATSAPATNVAIAGVSEGSKGGKSGANGSGDEGDGIREGRSGSRGRISVLDLRRSQASAVASQPEGSASSEPAPGRASPEEGSGRREIVRELGLGTIAQDRTAQADKAFAARAPGAAGGADFSSMLAQKLQEAWNGEIVQAAHIVLKDGDAGTIRLKLRPESLGDVKIELNLSDKSISGKIVVESDEAKSAFERNMAELADAFRQGGFETASLEVSVGSGSGREQGGSGQSAASPFFSERLRAADVAVGPAAAGAYARRGSAVDILV
jgi:flagellar hook-length control protein FliK